MKITPTLLIIIMLASCTGSPYRFVLENEIIENPVVSFIAPDKNWKVVRQLDKLKQRESFNPNIYANIKGATMGFGIKIFPYKGDPNSKHFNKNYVFKELIRDSDMILDDNEKEQGISYMRGWTVYIAGLKCGAGVFSRAGRGFMKQVNSKNYNMSCGYYKKSGRPQLMWITYDYLYAGDSVRQVKDKDVQKKDILTLEQTELYLKKSVKKMIDSLVIKDMDVERMQREGLLHTGKEFEVSPF